MTASNADRTTIIAADPSARAAEPARVGVGRPLRLHVVRDLRDPVPGPIDGEVPAFDVVVAPGGLTRSAATTVEVLRDAYPLPVPIVCVLGNDEFRGQDRKRAIESARRSAHRFGVTLLEDSAEVVMGVRFVGATFWTDFRLHGSHVDTMERAFDDAEAGIGYARHMRSDGRPFDPYAAIWAHAWSRVWITRECAVPFDGPTVVITHHAPSARSLPEGYGADPLAPARASALDAMVECSGAALWIHGHVSGSVGYVIGGTRVVANPGGAGHGDDGSIVEVCRGKG